MTSANSYLPSGPDMVVATTFSLLSNKAIDMSSISLPSLALTVPKTIRLLSVTDNCPVDG
jgi:hypothetical protein